MTSSPAASSDVDQGGLEAVSTVDRIPALTGVRAFAALIVVGTHAAYTTGKYTHGYVGLLYSRLEIGVPIFFVLSGLSAVRSVGAGRAGRRCGAVAGSLRTAPDPAHHAGLRAHRARRVPALPLP